MVGLTTVLAACMAGPAAALPNHSVPSSAMSAMSKQAITRQATPDRAIRNLSAPNAHPLTLTARYRPAAAAAPLTPAQAVVRSRASAAANGINQYLSVRDRRTGAVLAQSGSATQVASESIMKLLLASYYLVLVGGYQHQSARVLANLSYMIRYSDDSTANAYFSSGAIPTIAARYGLRSTINATDRVGHWGAARITAADMTTFLYRAAADAQVGPWLLPVMAQVAPVGSDGFNQAFGMNSLGGRHGSKQGWGGDEYWSSAPNVINSVGYTDRYYVAILQNSHSYPDPARATSTYAARTIAAAGPSGAAPAPRTPVLREGDFVQINGTSPVYRIAGGAPVYVRSWSSFGSRKPVKRISVAQWRTLPTYPREGTFVSTTGAAEVYRIVDGAPIYVSSWSAFGRRYPATVVDAAAVTHAGLGGVYSHLRFTVRDGQFLQATGSGQVFVVGGGAPLYVAKWASVGGRRPTHLVDATSIRLAGGSGRWAHLRAMPVNGTFLVSGRVTFRVAGGAPLYVSTFASLTGPGTRVRVDPLAVVAAGRPGPWAHLRFYPADGTFLRGAPGTRVYRVVGGRPVYVPSWKPYGGVKPSVAINQSTISRAGIGGVYNHLRR